MTALAGADLLSVGQLTTDSLTAVLDTATALKTGKQTAFPLQGKHIAMIFQRPSNRTRVSFEVAINKLGGQAIALFGNEIQLGERESTHDVARILEGYVEGIVARLIHHQDLIEIADAVSVPTVNAMTEVEHPCQALADLLTVRELCGRLAGTHIVYLGDGNNVCASLMLGTALVGADLTVINPPGYQPPEHVLETALSLRASGSMTLGSDPAIAVENADIIYTDVWTSMGQEVEQQRRRVDFAHLQVNDALLAKAPEHVRVLHCLPAHRGEEITDSVMDGPQSAVFEQAENRLWAQMGLLSLLYGA